MTTKTPTLLGGAMIIAGTIIGAGMLANPTATSGVWFIGSLAVLLYTWFSMLASGLMILEANTHYPVGASFDTIVRDSLGKGWNIVNGLGVAFVLYLLTYAYIFVGGRLTTVALGFNPDSTLWIGQLAFFIIFAGCVWYSARLVDRLSSILIGGMVITFIWATGGLLNTAQLPILLDSAAPAGTSYWIYLGTALPVCLASFGFHGNVSSLYKYFNGDAPKVARALWIGTLIALVIYALWQLAIQGNLAGDLRAVAARHPRQPSAQRLRARYPSRRRRCRADWRAVQICYHRQHGENLGILFLYGDCHLVFGRNARLV